MKKKIFTMLLSLLTLGLINAQTVIFDPATYSGELKSGMEIIDVEGVKYLQVVLDGWNSAIDVPTVSDILGTAINGNVMYALGTPNIEAGLLLEDISSVVQIMDTVHRVPPPWDPSALVPAATSLTQNPTTEGWSLRKADITKEMTLVHQIQFFGQKTTDWNPSTGDTIWVGRLISVDATVLFDPASVDESTLPEGMEIVTEGSDKLLKVKLNGWSSNLPITPFEVGKNNKMTLKMKYDAGTSGIEPANAQCFVQPYDASGGISAATINPAPTVLTEAKADIIPNKVVTGIQIAAQVTSGDWPAIVDGFVYVGKITVSFAEAELAEAPITTVVAYSSDAAAIAIDGLYDDAYGEVANIIDRVASNETGGDISETNSYGEWLAVGDLENFYIYIEVNDDDPIELGSSTTPWMNDGVELFVDIQNRRYKGSSRIGGEQHQFRINFGTEGPATADFGMSTFFGDNDTTNIEFAVIASSGGYVIEARIPWATWYRTNSNTSQDALDAIDLMENMKVAFEVSILDANAPDGRQSILNWSNNTGADRAYLTPEFWGEVTLQGGWPTAISDKIERTALGVYPNPANSILNIQLDNASNAQLFNMLGAKVLDVELKGAKSINVANLNSGVYVIKVADSKGKIAVGKFNKN